MRLSLGRKDIGITQPVLPMIAALSIFCSTAPLSAQTRAGTAITNTAAVAFTRDGADRRVESNSVTLIVAERLDIGLSPGPDMPVLTERPTPLPVRLTNNGSGEESFAVEATAMVPAVAVTGIAIDADADGRYDPAIDAMLNGTTPTLAPGTSLNLLAIVAPMPGAVPTDGTLTVTARAVTGSGTPADSFDGGGDGGGDAVVGETGAVATAELAFVATRTDAPTLVKTQSVLAADGSSSAVAGAVVTYTLVARFPGGARDARIDDPVPAGTSYVPGSLMLDGAALDDGAARDGTIAVPLGDVAAATTRTVRFQVRLP